MNTMVSVGCYVVSSDYGDYLIDALDSLLAQDDMPEEVVFVDVGSSDNTLAIFTDYVWRFLELGVKPTVVEMQKSSLLDVIDKVPIGIMKSEYVFRLDADDYLDAGFVKVVREKADKGADLVYSGYFKVSESREILSIEFAQKLTCLSTPCHGACTLLRRNLLRDIRSFSNFGLSGQDGLIVWIWANKRKASMDFHTEPLFYYRQHGKSLTFDSIGFARKRLAVFNRMLPASDSPLLLNWVVYLPPHLSRHDLIRSYIERVRKDSFMQSFTTNRDIRLIFLGERYSLEIIKEYASSSDGQAVINCRDLMFEETKSHGKDHFHLIVDYAVEKGWYQNGICLTPFIADNIEKPCLDVSIYELIYHYFSSSFSKKIIATGRLVNSVSIEKKCDFSSLYLPQDLRRVSNSPRFVFEGGLFGVSKGAILNTSDFIPVLL